MVVNKIRVLSAFNEMITGAAKRYNLGLHVPVPARTKYCSTLYESCDADISTTARDRSLPRRFEAIYRSSPAHTQVILK